MYHELKEVIWLEVLKKDIADFVAKCPNCKQVKKEHKKQDGLFYEIQVPTLKLEDINADFVVGLPQNQKQYDSIWVIVDKLTKLTHFILVMSTYSVKDYARIFIDEIVCRHGIPLSIISDRGTQFTSRFLRFFQKGLVTKVKWSTAFHTQTDCQAECTI